MKKLLFGIISVVVIGMVIVFLPKHTEETGSDMQTNEVTIEDEDEDDDEVDYIVMVVSAPDGFAAVRTGRGVQIEEVGRINNGHKAYLTDLQNGWYKIAKGKYKGYYTHQSSYSAG